jgi:hypothetical protein
MQDKIAIVLPVKDGGLGRHNRLIRCLASYKEMTEGLSDIHLLHDEDECDIYHPIAEQYPEIINYCIPTGISLMQKINVHALDIANKYKYVGFIGDDIVFKTIFESPFIQQLSSVDYGMVYGNDLVWEGKLATHPIITSNAITAVGFFGCPAVEHNYFDNYWHIIFSNLGKSVYFPGIIMEHIHPINNKEEKDEIYYNIRRKMNTDEIKFERYKQTNLHEDLNKIKAIITK